MVTNTENYEFLDYKKSTRRKSPGLNNSNNSYNNSSFIKYGCIFAFISIWDIKY